MPCCFEPSFLSYDVPVKPSSLLSGLPGWRETYDIEAKAPANAVPAGLFEREKRRRTQGMVRRLLADRFKLVTRVDLARYSRTVPTCRGGESHGNSGVSLPSKPKAGGIERPLSP